MEAIVQWAERELGTSVLRTESLLPEDRRSRVLRCTTGNGTVILKQAPDGREADGLRRLDGTGLTPRFLAGDPARGLVLMEDLGGERLDVLLLRKGESAALRRLVQFAEALGRMHARTAGTGPSMSLDLERICAPWSLELREEDRRALTLEASAYTQGDVGPDNAIVVRDEVRLIDFEIGDLRHPLTDAVAWRMGFPFGGCTGFLPADVRLEMDDAYRDAAGAEASAWEWGCAYVFQLLGRLDRFHQWKILEEDWTWGRATGRQRLLALLNGRPAEAPLAGELDALSERLRNRWPEARDTLPPYPALSD